MATTTDAVAGEIKAFFPDKHVTIADISDDILVGRYDQALRDELRRQLDALGVELRLGTALAELPSAPPATLAPIAIPLGPEGGAGLLGVGVADAAPLADLKGRHMGTDHFAALFDTAPPLAA
jgi:hypothetical protein